MTCGRCHRSPNEHPSGNCPDGGGTYTFVVSDETAQWIHDNRDVPEDQLVALYIARLRQQKRVYGLEAAGAGDAGPISDGVVLGACPSCGAELRVGDVLNPLSGRVERSLQHPLPFCAYFGETDAAEIEREIGDAASPNTSASSTKD
jgi:hypothetical protein